MTLGSRRSAGTRAILGELPSPTLGPLGPLKATSKIRHKIKSSHRTRESIEVDGQHHQQQQDSRRNRHQDNATIISTTAGQFPAEEEATEEEQAETPATATTAVQGTSEATGTDRSTRATGHSVSLPSLSSSSRAANAIRPSGRAVDQGLITVRQKQFPSISPPRVARPKPAIPARREILGTKSQICSQKRTLSDCYRAFLNGVPHDHFSGYEVECAFCQTVPFPSSAIRLDTCAIIHCG